MPKYISTKFFNTKIWKLFSQLSVCANLLVSLRDIIPHSLSLRMVHWTLFHNFHDYTTKSRTAEVLRYKQGTGTPLKKGATSHCGTFWEALAALWDLYQTKVWSLCWLVTPSVDSVAFVNFYQSRQTKLFCTWFVKVEYISF